MFEKPHRQPQSTLQHLREDRVLFLWVDLHISLYGQQHPKRKQAIRLVCLHLFSKLRSSSNPINKKLT
jgi:hypothetical protein